jgi:hypothetical protein
MKSVKKILHSYLFAISLWLTASCVSCTGSVAPDPLPSDSKKPDTPAISSWAIHTPSLAGLHNPPLTYPSLGQIFDCYRNDLVRDRSKVADTTRGTYFEGFDFVHFAPARQSSGGNCIVQYDDHDIWSSAILLDPNGMHSLGIFPVYQKDFVLFHMRFFGSQFRPRDFVEKRGCFFVYLPAVKRSLFFSTQDPMSNGYDSLQYLNAVYALDSNLVPTAKLGLESNRVAYFSRITNRDDGGLLQEFLFVPRDCNEITTQSVSSSTSLSLILKWLALDQQACMIPIGHIRPYREYHLPLWAYEAPFRYE